MTLQLFLRAIATHMFQPRAFIGAKDFMGRDLGYDGSFFHIVKIHAKDGFNVSIQINHGNYCSSENGYRKFGFNWDTVEFGFTSIHEPLFDEYSEESGDTTKTVGRIPIEVAQSAFDNRGGIDWEKTLSLQACYNLMGKKVDDGFQRIS